MSRCQPGEGQGGKNVTPVSWFAQDLIIAESVATASAESNGRLCIWFVWLRGSVLCPEKDKRSMKLHELSRIIPTFVGEPTHTN
jgi:hypothetical protein